MESHNPFMFQTTNQHRYSWILHIPGPTNCPESNGSLDAHEEAQHGLQQRIEVAICLSEMGLDIAAFDPPN